MSYIVHGGTAFTDAFKRVNQLLAGTNITLTPTDGQGEVLIDASGGGAEIASGLVSLVAGQQNYNILFAAGFLAAPGFLSIDVQMPNSSGEVFAVSPDLSTLTKDGVTVWLSGVPTAASAGGKINWGASA